MLGNRYKQTLNKWLTPLGSWIARLGISPSAITLAGLLFGILVCVWFLHTRKVILFCMGIMAVGCFDALDGVVARVSGRITKFGAYLDAVCDRYFESVVVLTVAAVTGYWALSLIMLAGALLTSYTKARAAMEVAISNVEWPDLLERTERSILFIAGLALSATRWQPLGHDLFWWTLVILAILTHLTALQRIIRARKFILERTGR